MTDATAAGQHWLKQVVSGLPARLKLVLLVALTVIVLDHAAKLGAAWLEPVDYMHNPAPMAYFWVMLLPALALLFPSRVMAGLFAVWLGGSASNVIDVYVWPGGVPDFIPMGDWVWNPADFAIYGGAFALVGWPVWALFRIARRRYPEPVPHAVESLPDLAGYPGQPERRAPQAVTSHPLSERIERAREGDGPLTGAQRMDEGWG